MGRLGERETMSEHDEEEDSYDEEIYETRSGRSGAYSGFGGAMGRRSGRSGGRRDRERERSGSRERSLSPRIDRRLHNLPPRPAKVTLVKSRKNEGEAHKVWDKKSIFIIYQIITRQSFVWLFKRKLLLDQGWLTAKVSWTFHPQQISKLTRVNLSKRANNL